MEAEFVNEYISKLTLTLHDQVSKNVLLETKLAMLEKNIARVQEDYRNLELEHTKLNEEFERSKKKVTKDA